MGAETTLVLAKGLIADLVCLDPVAYIGSETEVVWGGAVELVGEGAEETVAVAEGGGCVEAEGTELVGQELVIFGRVGEDLEDESVAAGEMRTMCAPCLYSISLSASVLSPPSQQSRKKRHTSTHSEQGVY
jgi:hypothetical protein